MVNKQNIEGVFKQVESDTNNELFSKRKTIIVFGETKNSFSKSELLYFNGVSTFVVFYLINKDKNKFFFNDNWLFVLGLNYKRFIRKIYSIVRE